MRGPARRSPPAAPARRRSHPRSAPGAAALLVAVATLAAGGGVSAAAGGGEGSGLRLPALPVVAMHGMRAGPRPLATRLAEADHAVAGTVAAVTADRIAVEDGRSLMGSAPARFEVKRSPLRPPDVAPGDRVLWLLRGARPPYVMMDEPSELQRLPAGEEDAWARAVRELARVREEPAERTALYEEWVESGPLGLAEEALRALATDRTVLEDRAGWAERRVATALDPDRSAERRSASAYAAGLVPRGAEMLLRALGERPDVPVEVVHVAVQAGALLRSPQLEPALRGLLESPREDVRRAAARHAARRATHPDLLRALEEAARSDPDEEVRDAARRALERAAAGRGTRADG